MKRDHVHGHRRRHPLVDGCQQKGLSAATGRSGDSERVAPHIRELFKKIQPANPVPQLQPGNAQSPQLLARPAEQPVFQLAAVVVTDQVVRENDETLACEIDGAARHGYHGRVFEPAIRPVSVR